MSIRPLLTAVLLVTMLLASVAPPGAQARGQVDLALVLAVDVSLSMDEEEQQLQRFGYVGAFRDPEVVRAIRSGLNGRIAVSYLEWAGHDNQRLIVPWHVIGSADEAQAFADVLARQPISRARMTSISGALEKSVELLRTVGVDAVRRAIDVSGDGPNNAGVPVLQARSRVLEQGIVINGLAIQLPRRGGSYSYFDLPDLDRYYAACVIGGPGSFVLSVNDKAKLADAIRRKLLLEIAQREPVGKPGVVKAQFSPKQDAYDCLIGEKRWREYLQEIWRD